MPHDDLSEVMREAYILSPSNLITIHTLEIRHPTFSSPLRIVRDNLPFDGMLEASAPIDAGQIVTFVPFWFNFIPPEITGDPDPTFKITVDNLSGQIRQYLDLATGVQSPVAVSYRPYNWDQVLNETANSGLPSAEPLHMEAFMADDANRVVSFTITLVPLANMPFPKDKYTPNRFPGLS